VDSDFVVEFRTKKTHPTKTISNPNKYNKIIYRKTIVIGAKFEKRTTDFAAFLYIKT